MLIVFIYIFLATFSEVTAVIIDMKKDKSYTHCAGSADPVILKSPFDDVLNKDYALIKEEDWFIFLSWYYIAPGKKEEGVIVYTASQRTVLKENMVPYNTWGLQITKAQSSDSGVYSVRLNSLEHIEKASFDINITFVDYPKLKSDKFTTDVKTNADGSKTYFCGELATLGEPPVNILWRAENGTILPSSYRNGFQWLEEPANEDNGKVYCEVNKTSPSYLCIPPNEKGRWDETHIGELTTAADFSESNRTEPNTTLRTSEMTQTVPTTTDSILNKTKDSNLMIYIIAGCAGGVALIVAIVVVVLICKKRSGEKYNARGEESKTETDGEQKSKLMSSNDHVGSSNSNERGSHEKKTPIYRGSSSEVDPANYSEKSYQKKAPVHKGSDSNNSNNSPKPRHSYPRYQPETQDDYEAYDMNGKERALENDAPPPVAPKYRKKSEPLIDSQGNEVRPPTKKNQEYFLDTQHGRAGQD